MFGLPGGQRKDWKGELDAKVRQRVPTKTNHSQTGSIGFGFGEIVTNNLPEGIDQLGEQVIDEDDVRDVVEEVEIPDIRSSKTRPKGPPILTTTVPCLSCLYWM